MKYFFLMFVFWGLSRANAQVLPHEVNIEPQTTYDNIHVQRIKGDSNYTAFIIWIKKEVKPHFHQHHTEVITVLEGKARMTMNDTTFTIRKGDVMVIPENTVHSVINHSKKPLKVISVQTPWFDGKDRIFKTP